MNDYNNKDSKGPEYPIMKLEEPSEKVEDPLDQFMEGLSKFLHGANRPMFDPASSAKLSQDGLDMMINAGKNLKKDSTNLQ